MRKARGAGPATDVREYLSSLPPDARGALERLRKTVKAIVPKATETISYGIPVFKHDGLLVGYAAFKNHCSFFVMSSAVLEAHKGELKGYDTSKGTIRFPKDRPLPAALVKKLVKARVRENEARLKARRMRDKRK